MQYNGEAIHFSLLQVEDEYESEYASLVSGERDAMDPYVYDLYHAVRYVEEFGGTSTLTKSDDTINSSAFDLFSFV